MFPRHSLSRALHVTAAVGASIFFAHPGAALAAGSKSCTAAYKNGVKLEQASQLREAQKAFSACSKAACGAAVRRECIMRYGQLGSDIPSVVPVVTDASGEPVLQVKVTMDGEVLTSQIDGRAVAVDPGLHQFSFSGAAGSATQKIVILQGQRNRPLAVTLGAGAKAAVAAKPPASAASPTALVEQDSSVEPPPTRAVPLEPGPSDEPRSSSRARTGGRPVATYLLGGVGLAGVAGYALLTYWGRKDNDMLTQCTPNCSPESVSHVKKLYLGANVSLGVGLAALGTATWLYVRSGRARREEAASHSGLALDVAPLPTGALASVRGAF
jgi:hypothetical protein